MKILKNPTRVAIKMFILVWIVLLLQVVLKLTFNYWQPYVIPNETMKVISDFIDNNQWLEITIDGHLYVLNVLIYTLCCLKQWWYKNIKQFVIILAIAILGYASIMLIPNNYITAIVISIVVPLIMKPKNVIYILLSFVFSNLFSAISFWLSGETNDLNMNYIISLFMNFDYYIMLVLNYFAFNLIKRRDKNGK